MKLRALRLTALSAIAAATLAAAPARAGQTVAYSGDAPAGTIVVETGERALYFITGKGQAIKYSVGVGRSGQQWFGTTRIVSKHIKPAWKPPESLRGRRSPDFYIESGSPKNPMGAAALVLRDNELAIHGTNNPGSIGGFVSAGCIRMRNKDVMDLFGRVSVGTRVVFPKVAVAKIKPPAVSAEAKPAAETPAASTDGAKAAETPAKAAAEPAAGTAPAKSTEGSSAETR
jgi:lipoprotein-anchoring transpeptidase ErfK/SrfK